jgi:hypothetical protein
LLGDVYRRTASGTSIDEPVLSLGGLDFYHLADRAGFLWRNLSVSIMLTVRAKKDYNCVTKVFGFDPTGGRWLGRQMRGEYIS